MKTGQNIMLILTLQKFLLMNLFQKNMQMKEESLLICNKHQINFTAGDDEH